MEVWGGARVEMIEVKMRGADSNTTVMLRAWLGLKALAWAWPERAWA